MKNVLKIFTLVFLVTTACASYIPSSEGGYPAQVRNSYPVGQQDYGRNLDIDYTYNYLAPYGNWVNMDPYGYVWAPRHMGYNWRPYSDGHWVWTDYGWTWISDQEWGWIPFHYGRWGWDNELGWFWVPGTAWGPAWVTWRSSDQYMGWAPLPPGMELRAGMNFASLRIEIPGNFWIFVGGSHFLDRDMNRYVLPYERNRTLINYTTMHNNFEFRGDRFINQGIRIDTIRRITQRDVPRYTLQDARQPGLPRITRNEVQIYRPSFREDTAARPKTVLNRDQARQELAPAKVFEPRQQVTQRAAESAVQKRQTEERRLMEKTQAEDLKAIDQQRIDEQKKVQVASEKAKIQQDYQAKKSEMAKQHQAEKQQLSARHKQDTEQVKRAVPAKKQAPLEKKKK